jgi:lysylphosphatidylglycerol synthetase-like protein (DUF2156 family)
LALFLPPDSEARSRAALFERAPDLAALIAFAAGAATVLALAAPSLPHLVGLDIIDRAAAEFPEWSASVGGVVLMALATGLRARLDTAWAAATALLTAAALYAFFRHDHPYAAGAAASAALVLGIARPAFYRHSRLTRLAPGRRVALAAAAVLALGVVVGLLWAGGRAGFADAPLWALVTDPHLGRPGRVIIAGAAALGALLWWRYVLTRPHAAPAPPADDDLARVDALVAASEQSRPDAQLAYTGDKSFLFVDDAFVMAARGGGSLVAMGAPVGKRAAWRPALVALRQEAERLALRPVVYAAPPELLPDLIDAGFRVDKVGENAVVDLAKFTLAGGGKQNLRTARRKFVEREHGVFELIEPPHPPALLAELKQISDAWLGANGAQEKAFSLGRFDPAFLARHPIAAVRLDHRIVAFANLWTTPDGVHAALDLMRFDPARARHGLMDFLFTEILLWAQAEEYRDFDLGMAPLAGLAEDQYAPLFARIGKIVYDIGEPLYGFQGLRKFKEKFGPAWEPRYLAAPGAWSMPIVLAEVGLLTSGGVAGLLSRPKKEAANQSQS